MMVAKVSEALWGLTILIPFGAFGLMAMWADVWRPARDKKRELKNMETTT